MSPHERLAELGLSLPTVPTPAAAYQPFVKVGDLIFTAGQLPLVDGELEVQGRLGDEVTTEEGARLAAQAGLNVLAAAAAGAGGLDRFRVIKVTAFVACTPDFAEQHLVANGASELLQQVLGDHGVHARSAVGMAALPRGAPVEIEAIVAQL